MTFATFTPSASLSTMLRIGSQSEHRNAESSNFMSELLAGRVGRAGYACYLGMLREVYAALELTEAGLRRDPLAAAVIDRDLHRLTALDDDVAFWSRDSPVQVDSPAVQAYVSRILACGSWGGLFIAHHYTRYLGDLSGGQAISRILRREFGLGDQGVAFYEFAAISKRKPYKDAYRARLDALPLDQAERVRVLTEVKDVFALNCGMFVELSARLPEFQR